MRPIVVLVFVVILTSCGGQKPGATGNASTSLGPAPAAYTPRVGLGVMTGSRTCIAIANANLPIGSAVTLISPIAPQTFNQAEIGVPSAAACPISKDVNTAVSNYDVHIPAGTSLPKLTPLVAVVGTAAQFSTTTSNNVQADLDQNGKTEFFRACSADDGIHVTVWSGNPLDGTLLWHGLYYEPSNPGIGPACTPKETVAP